MGRTLARRVEGLDPSRAFARAVVVAIAALGLIAVVAGATAVSGCAVGVSEQDGAASEQHGAVSEMNVAVSETEVTGEHDLAGHPSGASSSKFATARGWAVDEKARQLLRRAMIAIEVAYVDLRTYDPGVISPPVVAAADDSVTWVPVADGSAATAPTALAYTGAVNYSGTETTYAVGTVSSTGTTFGAMVDPGAGTTIFYVNGEERAW